MQEGGWEAIERLATEQSILGLVANRILTLPKELLPTRQQKIRLALTEEMITRHSVQQCKALHTVYKDYEDRKFFPIILKGLTMSQLYPRPSLRSLGDLDIFLPKGNTYEDANNWAKSRGYRLEGNALYEQGYYRGRLFIENHKYLTYFGISRYDKALSEVIADIEVRDAWAYTTIDGHRYRTLPLELNVVYVFHHILHHFSYLGIGLRQICDWLLLLSKHRDKLDLELFESYAKRFDLMKPMRLFALMAVRHLNIPAEIFPFTLPYDKRSEYLADLIIRDTFRGGNFGFEHFTGHSFKSIWSRRWFMFCRTTLRSFRVAEIAPEHIRLIPLIAICTRIKLLFRRK